MKIRIVHAVMIVAKRNRIPIKEIDILKGERGRTMNKKKILAEMIKIWKEQRGRKGKGQKGKGTGGREGPKGEKEEKRQKHILRLVMTMMDEDGSELLVLTRKSNKKYLRIY